MASRNSPEGFVKRMDVLANRVPVAAARIVGKTAVVVSRTAILKTPVKSGRARSGWTVTVGEPRADDPGLFSSDIPEQATQLALVAAQISIATYKPGSPPIFMANVVEYIGELEDGSSTQAPNGMTVQAVRAGSNYLRGAIRREESLLR